MRYALLLFSLLFGASPIWGQFSPEIDSSFGNNGIFNLPYHTTSQQDLFLQSDGKILVLAEKHFNNDSTHVLFMRLNSNGKFDSTYANNGINLPNTLFRPTYPHARPVLLSNDDLVIAGAGRFSPEGISNVVVHKYLSDGTPDVQFGSGGTVQFKEDSISLELQDIVADVDDQIYVLYKGYFFGQDTVITKCLLSKLRADGQPDDSFGVNGMLVINDTLNYHSTVGLAVSQDGSIYLTGESGTPQNYIGATFVQKINADWTFSEIFRSENKSFASLKISTDEDEKVILIRTLFGGTYEVWRLMPNGMPDVSFAQNGVLIDNPTLKRRNIGDFVLQPDGKLLLGLSGGATALRINANGTQDYSFDLDGVTDVLYNYNIDFGYATSSGIVIQEDGKIVFLIEDGDFKIKIMRIKSVP